LADNKIDISLTLIKRASLAFFTSSSVIFIFNFNSAIVFLSFKKTHLTFVLIGEDGDESFVVKSMAAKAAAGSKNYFIN